MESNQGDLTPQASSATFHAAMNPALLAQQGAAAWTPADLAGAPPQNTPGVSAYLHALRRRWLVAVGLGLLCAALAGPAAWFIRQPQYTATALLRVASSQQQLVFATVDRTNTSTFDIYKNTQQQLLKSDFVLIAALRDPKKTGISIIQEQPDPVKWLAEQLRADFPGNAEIMRVSLTSENGQEAAVLVNAVVDAYKKEVVDLEIGQRRERLSDLDRVHTEKETELRTKRTELKQLAGQLGTSEPGAMALKQQIAIQQYAELRRELAQTEFDLRRAKLEAKVREAAMKAASQSVDKVEVTPAELEAFAQADPVTLRLSQEQTDLDNRLADTKARATAPTVARYLDQYNRSREAIKKELETRRNNLITALREKKRSKLMGDSEGLQTKIAILEEQKKSLTADVEAASKQAGEVGGSSTDVELMRPEIAHLEGVLSSIAQEREKLKVELGTKARIEVLQKAADPRSEDNNKRLQLAVLATLAGFCLPMCGLVVWDVRAQRINSSTEVSGGLGLRVIGALPLIPVRAVRRPGSRSKRMQRWHALLHESINSIAARLLRRAEQETTRVILVSSAGRGEGKTTVATQLAMSFARLGHRTLLVDFDLRRPALDKAFQLPLEPGVGEILHGQSDLQQATQESGTERLSVITAGRWIPNSMGVLTNGAVGSLFENLRTEYEFVVVDGSPILPVADARLISQHVDAVILSVLRDVSRGPRVVAACEILAAFGVQTIGAVVTGSTDNSLYERDLGLESSATE